MVIAMTVFNCLAGQEAIKLSLGTCILTNETLSVSGDITNNSAVSADAVFVIAVYDSAEKMVAVNVNSVSVGINSIAAFSKTIVSCKGASLVKAFLLENSTSRPIAYSVTKSIGLENGGSIGDY
jgi:hypothetical protein